MQCIIKRKRGHFQKFSCRFYNFHCDVIFTCHDLLTSFKLNFSESILKILNPTWERRKITFCPLYVFLLLSCESSTPSISHSLTNLFLQYTPLEVLQI